MRTRLIPLGAALVLLLAACGGSSGSNQHSSDSPSTSTTALGAVDSADTTAANSTEDLPEPDDGSQVTTTTAYSASDPALNPIGAAHMVDDLITGAAADGTVTAAELAEILVAVGTPAGQANCEGDILSQLGVTDPTDLDAIRTASVNMTTDQQVALGNCITGG